MDTIDIDDYPEEVVRIDSEFIEDESYYWYRCGTNDYSIDYGLSPIKCILI